MRPNAYSVIVGGGKLSIGDWFSIVRNSNIVLFYE